MDAPIDLVLCRWAFFGTAMILFGSSLFPLYAYGRWTTTGARDRRGAAIVLAALALLAAIAWLLALSHQLDDTTPIFETVRTVLFETSFGPSWIARLILTAAAVLAAAANWRLGVVAAAAGMLICEGWDGHAAAHGLVGEAVQAVHVVCAGAWIGGLFPLGALVASALREHKEGRAVAPVRRFSNVAMAAVALILVTGVVNILLLGPELNLTGLYVRVLATKLALFALMIGCAAYNRLRAMPLAIRGEERRALNDLLRMTLCEQALAAAILLAVATLGLLDPYMPNM